jgi:dTDP-glucose pyrophosphorylase
VCLILGDNIFYGHGFYPILEECTNLQKGGIIFGYQVTDPHRYGIVAFDDNRNVLSIEEVTFRKGLITAEQLQTLAHPLRKTPYGQYLTN